MKGGYGKNPEAQEQEEDDTVDPVYDERQLRCEKCGYIAETKRIQLHVHDGFIKLQCKWCRQD